MRPPCQVAQAQAPVQACLRPSMWCPGAKNLHSARETWQIDANLTEVMNTISTQLQELKLETEILELHKVRLQRLGSILPCSFVDALPKTSCVAFLLFTKINVQRYSLWTGP